MICKRGDHRAGTTKKKKKSLAKSQNTESNFIPTV